jgi:hypothetical protein
VQLHDLDLGKLASGGVEGARQREGRAEQQLLERVESGVPSSVELPAVAQLPVSIPIRPATFAVRR